MCYHNLRLFIITPESSEWERNLRSFFRTRIKLLGLARENWEDKKRRREKRFSFCKPHFVKASFGFNFFHRFPFNFQSYLIYFPSQHLKTRAKRFSSSAFRLVSTSFLYLCLCKWKPLPAQGGCRYLRLRLFIEQKCKWKYLKKRHCQTSRDGYNVIFHPLPHLCLSLPHTYHAPSFFCLFIMILQLYLNNIIDFFHFSFGVMFLFPPTSFAIYTFLRERKRWSGEREEEEKFSAFSCHRRNFCIRIMDIYIA